jgi:uncharacterized protein (TIGR03067 family)
MVSGDSASKLHQQLRKAPETSTTSKRHWRTVLQQASGFIKEMAIMRILLIASLFLTSTTIHADDDSDKALKSLQGKWKAVSILANGDAVPEEQVEKTTVMIKEKELVLSVTPDQVATIALDSTQKPAWIDLTNHKKEKFLGIYELKGETLKICLAGPGEKRPAGFESTKEGKTAYLVLKRDKS